MFAFARPSDGGLAPQGLPGSAGRHDRSSSPSSPPLCSPGCYSLTLREVRDSWTSLGLTSEPQLSGGCWREGDVEEARTFWYGCQGLDTFPAPPFIPQLQGSCSWAASPWPQPASGRAGSPPALGGTLSAPLRSQTRRACLPASG